MTEVGKSQGTYFRALYQWNIPDNLIPDNAIIESVEITYMYTIQGVDSKLTAEFFSIPADISTSQDYTSIWNMFAGTNSIGSGYSGDPNTNMRIPYQGDMAKFNDAVKRSLPDNRFVLGIMSNAESLNENRYFYINTGYVSLKITYSLPHQIVKVIQLLSTGAEYGNVGRYEGNSFIDRITGTDYNLEVGATHYFRADTNKATVADEKFNYWNTQENVINHNGFRIDSTTRSIISHFNRIGTSTIKNALEGVSSVSGDKISFKDPWLRDDNLDSKGLRNRGVDAKLNPFSSPLILSITNQRFKGVLLNQAANTSNPNYYSARAKQTFDLFLPQTGKTHSFYFVDWTASNASVSNPRSLETPVVFTANNSEVLANYKGSQLSNTQTAFSNSGQRKFIMTPDGYYHLVYESMGKIWYERSLDGGTTWVIENGGKPLNTDYVYTSGWQYTGSGSYTVAKHPSIDYYQDRVVIVWQEQSGSNYVVRICFMQNGGHTGPANCIPFTTYGQYSEDIWPEIAVKEGGKAVIAIRRNDPYLKGLEIHYMTLYPEGGTAQEETSGWITGTDQNTGMFSLAADRSNTDKFHIAWQENGTTSTIQYSKFNFSYSSGEIYVTNPTSASSAGALEVPPPEGQWSMNILSTINVSGSTGYTQSYCPSMIGVGDGTARLAFKGFRQYYYGGGSYSISSCCPENLSWIPYLRKYSDNVYSPQINQGSQTYFVAWTELLSGSYRTIATDASTLRNMETVDGSFGRDIQINNGGLRIQQFSMGFNSESTALPYSFKRSTALGDIQVNKKAPELSGRGIYLTKDESQVYFILGNITSGKEIIGFTEAHDSVRLDGDLKKVNHYMTTEPFSLKENTTLTFAAVCGTRDSAAAASGMKNGHFASFTLEMIDDASGRVLGSYLDERIDKNNIFSLKESVFKVTSDGIVNRLVRLRVSVAENMKSRYTISDMFLGGGIPLSKASKEMTMEASSVVKEYSLQQNYPNPFNPTTLISYAIPRASKVTLKVYNILGKEVATLVNEYKEMGKYSVQFNASSLPSGTYIYEIRANDFVKSGKMMLLK